MSAVYAFLIEMLIYKDLAWKDVPKVLLVSANMSAMILYIVTNAVLFSFLMTSEQIPQCPKRIPQVAETHNLLELVGHLCTPYATRLHSQTAVARHQPKVVGRAPKSPYSPTHS